MVMAAANLAPSFGAREAMEQLNSEAGKLHIWLRTQANAPAQRPWFRETGIEASGQIARGPGWRRPAQAGCPSLAMERNRALSRPHRRDRARR